jgi:ATP-dependent helicase/nuclease subunit B
MTLADSKNSTQIPGVSTQTVDYQGLFSRLKAGRTLITANSRLTRVLTDQYNHWRILEGDTQWQSPDIVSWRQWLDKLWETASLQGVAGTDRAVPGNRQLISLWENTLKNEPLARTLLRPESLASQLRDTRSLIAEWQVDLKDPAWFGHENENHAAFHQWNRVFDKHCQQANWINPDDRSAILCKAIMDKMLTASPEFDLIGFDEFNPGRTSLLAALIDSGSSVCQLTITPRQKQAVLWKSKDGKDELQYMARWVRYWFEKEPDAAIAIVVPDLQARRQEVERALSEILTPGNHTVTQRAIPWNISMGRPLARVPMIETAFDMFKLLDERIDIQVIGQILRSPWLRGSEVERNSRALLEKCLRENYPRQLKLDEFKYRASEINTRDRHNNRLPEDQQGPSAWNSPQLSVVLETLIHFKKNNKGQRPASKWAELFDQLLVAMGWPLAEQDSLQSNEEHSHNWQALQAWREALRELASLDATIPVLGRLTAINQLKQICREKIFQARTPAASVQVLGLYEISGLRFDHLWVVGLHNDTWPTSAKPNPFIPGKLQRAVELPNSSPQRELTVARTITRRLLETAPDCVFSYPGQLDGEESLPSPLLNNDEIRKVDDLPGWQGDNWWDVVARAEKPHIGHLEMPARLEHSTARGGSSILKNQALCPFRAFASNRLGAEGMEIPVDGISPKLHGSLVHKVLERFWKETKSQAGLLQLEAQALASRVQKYVDEVCKEERGLKQRPAFLEVEAKRVHRHVMEYLALETQRDPFEVIGFEKEILSEIEGQGVRLVIDRIDRLPSGEQVIIDYKTGKVEPKKWFGDRPEDPQLPLYAISAEATPAAVAFGIIRDDHCLFKGVVTRPDLLPGLPPKEDARTRELVEAGLNISETIENWRQILHRLMAEFLAGQAAIDPKHENTCKQSYCELQSLCRIGELSLRQKTQVEDGQQTGRLVITP